MLVLERSLSCSPGTSAGDELYTPDASFTEEFVLHTLF